MNVKMRHLAPFICAALSVGTAEAGNGYLGVGTARCGNWVEARKIPNSPRELHIRLGYLVSSAVLTLPTTVVEGEMIGEGDADALMVWVDNYCRESPLATLGEAANSLSMDLFRSGTTSGKLKFRSQ